MELNGFIDEDRLDELFLDKQITVNDYVKHHSQGMLDAYMAFIKDNDLPDDDSSASRFLDEENLSMAREIDDEKDSPSDKNDSPVDVFNLWKNDNMKLSFLMDDCSLAAKVTLWRYNNPASSDMGICASQIKEETDGVEEWWNTIDFINGSLGGGHFRLANPTLENVKTVISDAVSQAMLD